MKLLQEHFPALKKIDGITMLSGKPYINHPGLLFLAKGKIHSKTTRMLPISNVEKGDFYFECTIVTMDGRTFNGHGNANSGNIKGVAKNRAFEMAEVRAQNRALREMLALGDTTAEEIDEGAALHGDAEATGLPNKKPDIPATGLGPYLEDEPDGGPVYASAGELEAYRRASWVKPIPIDELIDRDRRKSEARAKPHANDWEDHRVRFMVAIKDTGFTYEEVCYIMEVLKKDRPSQMGELARANLLGWLGNLSEQTRDRYKDDYKVDCQGAPSKGDTNV